MKFYTKKTLCLLVLCLFIIQLNIKSSEKGAPSVYDLNDFSMQNQTDEDQSSPMPDQVDKNQSLALLPPAPVPMLLPAPLSTRSSPLQTENFNAPDINGMFPRDELLDILTSCKDNLDSNKKIKSELSESQNILLKNQGPSYLKKGVYGVAVITAVNALNENNFFGQLVEKRVVGIDDLLFANVSSSLIQPFLVSGLCLFAWYKLEGWIKQDDVYRFNNLRDNTNKQFDRIEQNAINQYKKLYEYIDKRDQATIKLLENQYHSLLDFCKKQDLELQMLVNKTNAKLNHKIEDIKKTDLQRSQEIQSVVDSIKGSITNAQSEMEKIHAKIEPLKVNNQIMKLQVQSMIPIIDKVHSQVTNLGHDLAGRDMNEELDNIEIPEEKDDTPPDPSTQKGRGSMWRLVKLLVNPSSTTGN